LAEIYGTKKKKKQKKQKKKKKGKREKKKKKKTKRKKKQKRGGEGQKKRNKKCLSHFGISKVCRGVGGWIFCWGILGVVGKSFFGLMIIKLVWGVWDMDGDLGGFLMGEMFF